jgi:hypothetical protein
MDDKTHFRNLEFADFEGREGRFRIILGPDKTIEVELTAVETLPTQKIEGVREAPFVLTFVGNEKEILDGGMYLMETEGLERVFIGLSPFKQAEGKIHYEAVYS